MKIDFKSKRKTVTVTIEELGEPVTLRALSVGQFSALKNSDDENALKQIAMSLIDPDTGEASYAVEDLREMSGPVLKQIIEELNVLHGITKEETAEAVKKYIASQTTDSVSA